MISCLYWPSPSVNVQNESVENNAMPIKVSKEHSVFRMFSVVPLRHLR